MRKAFKPRIDRLETKVIPSGIFWSPTLTPVEYGGGGEIGSWSPPQRQYDPMQVPPPSSVAG